jgi:transcriptional regulator with XRE-family HTH domain
MSNLQHIVGSNIRRRRQTQGLSQQSLADRADLSRRMITLIEAGDGNASLATLDRLAAALSCSFADLIAADAPAVRTNAITTPTLPAWQGAQSPSRAHLLQSTQAREAVELWSWSLAPGDRYDAEADRPGMREIILVMQGTLRLELTDGRHRLTAGQSICFPSDQPYAYVNPGKALLTFVKNVVI